MKICKYYNICTPTSGRTCTHITPHEEKEDCDYGCLSAEDQGFEIERFGCIDFLIILILWS